MCGSGRKRFYLSLAVLLLLCSLCGAQEYDGPTLPEGWYPISSQQLQALRTELDLQQSLVDTLRTQRDEALRLADESEKASLETLNTLTSLTPQLAEAEAYLMTLTAQVNALVWQRNIAVVASVALAIGLLLSLLL